MHALWHALQPMHLEMSMSFATGICSRTSGGCVVVAERRLISSDWSGIAASYAFATFTRNALNSGVWVLASPT